MIKRKKIAIIGAGQIGGIVALLAGLRNLGDVILYDIAEGLPQGKALDISHLAPIFNCDFKISGSNKISDIEGADVCIVTSGLPRKPGMSRDDLLNVNADIIRNVAAGLKQHAPQAFVIVTTNPLDAMAHLMRKATGFPKEQVVGMTGVLDSGRYRAFLAEKLNVSVASISALVLGGHGDAMVPIRSNTTVSGIPVSNLISSADLDAIENRTRNAGAEVVNLLKTGSAFMSPAAACIQMTESYLYDQKQVVTAAAHCDGQYGVNGFYVGVPVVIGAKGVERIIEIELNESEQKLMRASIEGVQQLISKF